MAKAIFSAECIGYDGYMYAMREDGKIFYKNYYFDEYAGHHKKTAWAEETNREAIEEITELASKAKDGETRAIRCFSTQLLLKTQGLKLRLPN